MCGQAAWFFDPRDAGALATLVLRATHDEAGLGDLAAQGLARGAHFTWGRSAQALLDVVGQVARSTPFTQTAGGDSHPSGKGAKG